MNELIGNCIGSASLSWVRAQFLLAAVSAQSFWNLKENIIPSCSVFTNHLWFGIYYTVGSHVSYLLLHEKKLTTCAGNQIFIYSI